MRAWTNLWRFVSSLIGALTGRRPRRGGEEPPVLRARADVLVAHPQVVDVAVSTRDAGSAPSLPPEADTIVEQPRANTEAWASEEISPVGEALAEPDGDDPVVSSPADGFSHESPRVGIRPLDAAFPGAGMYGNSIPEIEVTEPVLVSTATIQSESSATVETSQVQEPPSNSAVVETPTAIAAPDVSSPHADPYPELPETVAPDAGIDRESGFEDVGDASANGSQPTIVELGVETVLVPEEGMDSDDEADDFSEELWADDEILETEDGSAGGNQPVGPHRPRPKAGPAERRLEPFTEYAITAPRPQSDDYRKWNRAIAEHLLLNVAAGEKLYLTITPRILARALVEVQGTIVSSEEAQQHFANAVSALYRERVLTQRARLRVLRRTGDDGLPECIGFLALTVLAAYRMRSDEEATGLAYYMRLGELLRCEPSGQYPIGFDPLVFESLWHFLRDWLAHRQGSRLIVPSDEVGIRRFVGLPLAHVPLRSLDIEKLPDFFVWAGYEPRSVVTADRLTADFARWIRARGALTPTGVGAFADARRAAVLAEIRAELDSWDGTCDESFSRRSAWVEVLFDPVQFRPDLYYVPRRPSGFPARFDDGVHAFEASDDAWYGRISIRPLDGSDLASGFNWRVQDSGVEFAMRRAAASVIALAPSDDFSYAGFMSAHGLRKNVRCAVLCEETVVQTATEYLSHVAGRTCSPRRHPDLPAGWSLFEGIVAHRVADPPSGLESLDVQANIGLIPSGGIRLGNRWAWLHGAPPRIIVSGSEPGLAVTVDGSPAQVDEEGMLQSNESLNALGPHVIQVGPLRRTVEIVEPSLRVDSPSHHGPAPVGAAPVLLALPPGRWTVVGAVPGQVSRSKYGHRGGTIVECAFAPSWAIRVGPGRGVAVLNVFAGVPPIPDFPHRPSNSTLASRGLLAWTTAIYDAAARHPRIDSIAGQSDPVAVGASWKSYARCAGQIKRAFRASRR